METQMNLLQLFERTLDAPYLEVRESAASYFTERKGETLYLFFEKSNGPSDWKNNLDFPAKPYRDMEGLWFAHRGFLRVFKSMKDLLAPQIADPRVGRIVISGYSHGAALALLTHEYCVFHRPDVAAQIFGYGFGCPRVVWGPVPHSVQARFRNFTVLRNHVDLVTHLPPALFGYRHVGNFLRIGADRRDGLIDSHRPENYLAALAGEETR